MAELPVRHDFRAILSCRIIDAFGSAGRPPVDGRGRNEKRPARSGIQAGRFETTGPRIRGCGLAGFSLRGATPERFGPVGLRVSSTSPGWGRGRVDGTRSRFGRASSRLGANWRIASGTAVKARASAHRHRPRQYGAFRLLYNTTLGTTLTRWPKRGFASAGRRRP